MLSIWISKLPFATEIGAALKQRWPLIEKVLIAGPFLIGYVLGLVRYNPHEKHFEIGFQSFCFFVGYMGYLILVQTLDSLLFSSWPIVLGVLRSLGAIAYLTLTVRQVHEWLSGKEVTIYSRVSDLRSRAQKFVSHAG